MTSRGQHSQPELPPYLTGTLLVRGRTRLFWTVGLVAMFVLFGRQFQDLLGHPSNALVAPLTLVLAWFWGRTVGVATAVLGVTVNVLWARGSGFIDSMGVPEMLDMLALAATAFLVGHIAMTLDRALGARDRTHQAYTELEQAARDRMLTITDEVPVGLYRTTPDGGVVGGNDALMKILGFRDREAMLRTNVWDHYVESEERNRLISTRDLSDGAWREFELRKADGSTIWARDWGRAVANAAGEVLHFDGVIEDVTEQHVVAERFRAAFEDSPYGMTISSVDGHVLKGNAAIAELLGRGAAELQGAHFSAYTFEDDTEATLEALAGVREGRVVRYEKRLRRRDGSFVWALISLAPIHDGSDEPSLFVTHVIDITARREAQEVLENLVRSKDELIASVSHELRTPLTVVHGLAQELDTAWESFSVAEQQEFVGLIAEQSAEVAHIVEDLLVAARADIGKLPIFSGHVDLLEQVESALSTSPDLAVTVEQIGDVAPAAFADPTRVRQILRNLLSNARRYGGSEVSILCGADQSAAWVEVIDDGEGIPDEDAAHIFEPYHRAHNAEGQPFSVGLGLTVSRKLAELMGGSLVYSFTLGHAIFRLELPVPGGVQPVSLQSGDGSSADT